MTNHKDRNATTSFSYVVGGARLKSHAGAFNKDTAPAAPIASAAHRRLQGAAEASATDLGEDVTDLSDEDFLARLRR